MKKGKTSTGFEFEIDENKFNNMEFLDALAESTEDGLAFPKALNFILSKEQKKALYDHVRTEDGRVPVEDIDREVTEMMEACSKN